MVRKECFGLAAMRATGRKLFKQRDLTCRPSRLVNTSAAKGPNCAAALPYTSPLQLNASPGDFLIEILVLNGAQERFGFAAAMRSTGCKLFQQ